MISNPVGLRSPVGGGSPVPPLSPGGGINGNLVTGIRVILPNVSSSGSNSIGGLPGTSTITLSPGVYPIPGAVGTISTN